MEWVETTAATVEQAKDALLDQLGVDEQEAEFEVLEEPKAGLFGRVRGQYRVRARIAPKSQRGKDEKRRRPAKSKDRASGRAEAPAADDAKGGAAATPAPAKTASPKPERAAPTEAPLEDRVPLDPAAVQAMAEDVAEFLRGLITEFGLQADVNVAVDEEGGLQGSVTGDGLGRLIGPKGGMMHALEELCRTRLQHLANGGSSPRFRLDVGGYRELRRGHLSELVEDVVERVRDTGKPHVLDVLTSAERKLVHDTVGVFDDVSTRSEGEEPNRRVAVVRSE